MARRYLTIVLMCGSLVSCASFERLDKNLEALFASLMVISGSIEFGEEGEQSEGLVIAVLTQKATPDEPEKLVDYRLASKTGRFNFHAPNGDYNVYAFLDQNRDFIYQAGEPTLALREDIRFNRLNTEREQWQVNSLRFQPEGFQQDSQAALPLSIDVSSQNQLVAFARPYSKLGERLNFSDSAFSDENRKVGMWEPARWLVEVGYGFYLLDDWQAERKPLVVFVHGINGAPDDWQRMANVIAKRDSYQLGFYHYPSGTSIYDNAHVLNEILNETQLRHPDIDIHIVAHSMGGLVAKRALQLSDESDMAHSVKTFTSISTPWLGHKLAEDGARLSPVTPPVWRDMAPKSALVKELAGYELPEHIHYLMQFGHEGNSILQGEPNDGAVALRSVLAPAMQDRAQELIAVDADHMGILSHARAIESTLRVLDGRQR